MYACGYVHKKDGDGLKIEKLHCSDNSTLMRAAPSKPAASSKQHFDGLPTDQVGCEPTDPATKRRERASDVDYSLEV